MEEEGARPSPETDARIVEMRDAGMSWKDIQQAFGLTRQQTRHAYQRGKRVERRAARRGGTTPPGNRPA